MIFFWAILVASFALAGVGGFLECYFQKGVTYPVRVRAAGFSGIIRDTVKTSLLGSGAGWITSILAKEFDHYWGIRPALLAALIVSLISALLGFYMSAMADVKTDPAQNTIEISSPFWFFVHGAILGLTMAVLTSLLVIVVVFAFNLTEG